MTTHTANVLSKAISTSWLNPHKDRIGRFRLSPITAPGGVKGQYNLAFDHYYLPDNEFYYALYDFGQINPNLFGFDTYVGNWTKLIDLSNADEMIVTAHVNNRMMSLAHTQVIRTENRSTIMAVRIDKSFGLLADNPDLTVQFYSNSWLATALGSATAGIVVTAYDCTTTSLIAAAFTDLTAKLANGASNTFVYINGFYNPVESATDISIGDIVDIVQDFSGVGSYDIDVDDIPFFTSTLDSKSKFLLLAEDTILPGEYIFFDDVTVFLYNEYMDGAGNTVVKGVCYDNFLVSNFRQVTPRDMSIEALRVKDILRAQDGELTYSKSFIRVFVRHANFEKELIDDGNLIRDLFLFDRTQRRDFMVGTNALIDEWTAVNLESSAYVRWIGLDSTLLTLDALTNVYSYHGLNKLIERPIKDGPVYTLAPVGFEGTLVLQYDSNRLLIGTDALAGVVGAQPYTLPAGVDFIETVPGEYVSDGALMELTASTVDQLGEYAEQYYLKPIDEDVWFAAVEGVHFDYVMDDNTAVFKTLYSGHSKLKRTSGKYHHNTSTLSRAELTENINIFLGDRSPYLDFETGRVDVWLNGRKLIRTVDYSVEWPSLLVTNVEFVQDSNELFILAHGLPSDRTDDIIGYVQHSLINYLGDYRLTFNRDNDIYIDGLKGVLTDIDFSETRQNNMSPLYREGGLYTISLPMNHVPAITLRELGAGRNEGSALTETIENYLTTKNLESEISGVPVIAHKHEVMSVTLHRLIADCNNGTIDIVNSSLTDAGIAQLLLPYVDIIARDVGSITSLDWSFLVLAAHNQDVTVGVSNLHYSFIEAVSTFIFEGKCQVNQYLHITT